MFLFVLDRKYISVKDVFIFRRLLWQKINVKGVFSFSKEVTVWHFQNDGGAFGAYPGNEMTVEEIRALKRCSEIL